MTELTITDKARLQECESTIERGIATFVEVGRALAEIRDRKLYKEAHKTFEGYCKDRWGHERNWAYQLIKASDAAQKCIGTDTKPNSEQARELSKAPPERQAKVWEKVVDDGEPTAAKVREAVASAVIEGDFDVDLIEQEPAIDLGQLSYPYDQAKEYLDWISKTFKELAEGPEGGHLVDKVTRILTAAKELKATISQMEPEAVCEFCDGDGCGKCASTGFWTKAIVQRRGK